MTPPRPRFVEDPWLAPFLPVVERRAAKARALERKLAGSGSLADFASAHEWYGLHRVRGGWTFREHAPNASRMWLVGDFSGWRREERFEAGRIEGSDGDWELRLPARALAHGQFYHLEMEWPGGGGVRLPAYARRVVQNPDTKIFAAQVWAPARPYRWRHDGWRVPRRDPLVYEAHVGMAQEEPKVGTWREFREKVLPRIAKAGYNTLQLMAVAEHPYYGSFGYQVSSFFAASSRFGEPEELKALVDAAHGLGIAVIMDLVHSHAVANEVEGLARFDGTAHCYLHDGPRGRHPVWDSVLFDYGRLATQHFLLSNCRFWLDEYRFDGFRFDGVTSMLYSHHGLGFDFTEYRQYFDETVDEDAFAYLALANRVIHAVRPDAITIAEDVSGMPGLAAPARDGGAGFDYRMAMGVTEAWGRLLREVPDERWDLGWLWHELTSRRADERTVSYFECHDQALVGGKTMFFEAVGPAIYDSMHRGSGSLVVERAVAVHEMARLATLASAGGGYLCFMGNEFGHPEWIDFPREGNGWSCDKARRRWSLRDDPKLQFSYLADWDEAMVRLFASDPDVLDGPAKLLACDDAAKVLAFARGRFVVILNFHWRDSHADWPLAVPPGDYRLLLDTDRPAFGGQGRIAQGQVFRAAWEIRDGQALPRIRVYLPSRTAMVLERVPGGARRAPSIPKARRARRPR